MKLTPEQLLEKKAREAIKRLINRVSSEYSFKKWRNLHGYLHSIGKDDSIAGTQDKELTRPELDELLRQYEENAFKNLLPNIKTIGQEVPEKVQDNQEAGTKIGEDLLRNLPDTTGMATKNVETSEEKFTDKNNYGLSKSEKESVVLFWFQKLAAANLLRGFDI